MREKLKILEVTEALGGGVFAYVQQLCNDMAEQFEISLAYATREQAPEGFADGFDPRVKLYEVPGFSSLTLPTLIKTIERLRQIEREVSPDIIHLHSSIAGGIGRIAYSPNRCKIVYTPHAYAFECFPHGMKSNIYWLLEKILGLRNCITLTCCKSEDEVARTLTKQTAFIETGIDLVAFSDRLGRIEPTKSNKFTVYTLGRARYQKRPDLFNRIAELVPEAKFVWVGSAGPEDGLVSNNIEITGWLPRYDALAIAKGADAFILCSTGEAVAMSLIENMYIGKLSLVSDVMGNKSVIKDGVNGYVCHEAEEYAIRIREAMAYYPKMLVDKARKDIETTYNTNVMSEKYVSFYNSLARNAG